jgi:hypothetical protein
MKKYLSFVFASFAFATGALASEVPVAEFVVDRQEEVRGFRYELNAELGRAWIQIKTWDSECAGSEDCSPEGEVRAKVTGLSLNAREEIVFEEKTVCARVVRKRFGPFKRMKIVATGACSIRSEAGERVVDDGFFRRVEKTAKVFFVTQ